VTRIVLVYNTERLGIADPVDMARIQLAETAHALARLGYEVDIATAELSLRLGGRPVVIADRLRRVPLARVDWTTYDVVETNFHQGWETLASHGGDHHPFIIAKLGSVVGAADMPGIYFYGRDRERMYATQQAIHQRARYVTLLSRPAQVLWEESFGAREGHLLVPGGAATTIPSVGADPYPERDGLRVLFAGNLYDAQPEANRVLSDKLSALGRLLAQAGARLFVVGPGDTRALDRRAVTHLGVVPYLDSWQYLMHADVGVVVSAGTFMHNNESTKIYHYLRAGLPVVSEEGFPNDDVVRGAGMGFVVPSGQVGLMAERVLDAAATSWNRESAVRFILAHHTWDNRMSAYHEVLQRHFAAP